jgi:signal peptidase I
LLRHEELQQRSATGCHLVADVVRGFGEVRLMVTGSSMVPAIWPGDVIIVHSIDKMNLQVGQVILYRREGRLVAHRITRVHGDLLITQGDTLQHEDPPVRGTDIVGPVVSLIRNGRHVRLLQSSWQRIGASILQQSDGCLRMTLRLGHRLRRTGTRGR